VSRYQKGQTNLDFTEARDSEWQWHQLGIRLAYGPADATATHCLLLQENPDWFYRLTRVDPDKGPLNECVCVCGHVFQLFDVHLSN